MSPMTETKTKDSVERIVEMLNKHLILEKEHLINGLKDLSIDINRLNQENAILKAKVKSLEEQHLIGSQHTLRDKI